MKKNKIMNFKNLIILSLFTLSLQNIYIYAEENQKILGVEYLSQKQKDDYILGPNDVLDIIFSPALPELRSKVKINTEGFINLPRLNNIYVMGLTTIELKKLLNESLKTIINFPDTEVSVLKHRDIEVYIEGEVNFPGMYILKGNNSRILSDEVDMLTNKNNLTEFNLSRLPRLFDIIKNAGGLSPQANITDINIRRIASISDGGGLK